MVKGLLSSIFDDFTYQFNIQMKKMLWSIAIPFLLFLLIASWVGKGTLYQSFSSIPESSKITNTNFKVIAHRGYSSKAPENTLSAFKMALEIQADMIELDVHLSKDNQVIVMHDANLERTTGLNATVRSKTLSELKQLKAGAWFGIEFNNEPVPSLEEVIQLVAGQSILLIEIKLDEQNEIYQGIIQAVLDLITKHNATDWCILQAFESDYLKEIQASKSEIPYYKLIVNTHAPVPLILIANSVGGT